MSPICLVRYLRFYVPFLEIFFISVEPDMLPPSVPLPKQPTPASEFSEVMRNPTKVVLLRVRGIFLLITFIDLLNKLGTCFYVSAFEQYHLLSGNSNLKHRVSLMEGLRNLNCGTSIGGV